MCDACDTGDAGDILMKSSYAANEKKTLLKKFIWRGACSLEATSQHNCLPMTVMDEDKSTWSVICSKGNSVSPIQADMHQKISKTCRTECWNDHIVLKLCTRIRKSTSKTHARFENAFVFLPDL